MKYKVGQLVRYAPQGAEPRVGEITAARDHSYVVTDPIDPQSRPWCVSEKEIIEAVLNKGRCLPDVRR